MLLPALPAQAAVAGPDSAPPTSLRARQPAQSLIAFLRDGNVWVANADGTDEQRLTTDGEADVTMFGFPPQGGEPNRVFYSGFSWSPDGHYLAITKDGPSRTREILLFDAQAGALAPLVTGIHTTAYLPGWATDANELLVPRGTEEDTSSGFRELLRVAPDGTVSEAPPFDSGRPVCGLPSGPGILPPDALMLRETLVLRDMVDPSFQWSASENRVLINRWCWAPQWLDLATGEQTPVLLSGEDSTLEQRGPGSLLLRPGDPGQGIAVGTPLFTTLDDLQIFDLASASPSTVATGYLAVWHPDGERILYSRSTTIAEHEVTSPSYPWTLRENATELFEAQRDGTAERLIAELPVYGVGWPSVSRDGEWLIVSAVENPTEAIASIPAGGQVTDEWLRAYPPPVNLYRVEIETGQTDLVVENAGWPKIQPEGMLVPVSDDEPTDLTGTPDPQTPEPETVDYPFSVPIVPYVCEQRPDPQLIAPGTTELPEGCTLAAGATFTVTGSDGVIYGSCTTPPDGGLCSVGAPAETDLLVMLDESTLPAGYLPIENPVSARLRDVANDADGARFIILPADVASGQAGTPAEGPPATDVAGTTSLQIEPGQDWIAYVGEDGNIWLMQPDGSQQTQVTTDGAMEHGVSTYQAPVWSPDGTVLVFHKADEGIIVYRDGTLTPVPGTAGCGPAAITLDNSRLLYSCASGDAPYEPDPTADQLATDPHLAAIASSNLDGTDARVLVPYTLSNSGQNAIPWVDSGLVGFNRLGDLAVDASTGEILATFGLLHSATAWIVGPGEAPALAEIPFSDVNQDRLGPFAAAFLPGGEQIVALVCEQGCYPDYQDQVRSILILNRDGSIAERLIGSDTVPGLVDVTVSPDATTVLFATYTTGGDTSSMIWSLTNGEGATPLHPGSSPAWQPNAGVATERPASAVTPDSASSTGASTTPATADQPAQAATNAVPNEFIATWSGRGVQENPYGEWAVTISITGGGIGEVVGTSEYPEEACGGNLILQEVTTDSIVLLEQLTYGQEACADDGTIMLSGVAGGACQFAWSGIGPYGTPSSAGGTLSRPDSATGSSAPSDGSMAGQPGTQDGPVVDTTQLHRYYIGTFSGTGKQTDPDSEWPITVTFTGGRPGEVVGTVEYPTLGCGGELILDSINPNDEWLGFTATERITYGHDNCIDGGTFTFSSESAVGIIFGWTNPVSATRASGNLARLEPGAPPDPADQAVEPSGEGQMVESDASGGGPPSIYDDPEAEPVPIEAEGG